MPFMQSLFGRKEPVRASSAADAVPNDRPRLTKDFTGQPEEAVDILFGEAMAARRKLTAD